MTPTGFNPSRAMDLSGIAAAAKAPPPPVGASYVLELDEASFEAVIQLSVKHPVVIELYSPRAKAESLSSALVELVNEAAGKYLLARVNVDTAPQIAAAFGVQAVPTVIAVVGGQLAPLFQGTREKADVAVVIGQLLQAAVGAGVVGRADPVSIAADAGPDPRFAAADAALERGDFAAAVAEFDTILARTPNDPEAKAGRAQAALLVRIGGIQPATVLARAAAAPDNVEAQAAAADVELAGGNPEAAFGRLIEAIRRTSGAEREALRVRVLELFETVGPTDPVVLSARRGLMSALF
ncbi:MAG: tetratricopeptide repeat protein [Propionicimonas sp.]